MEESVVPRKDCGARLGRDNGVEEEEEDEVEYIVESDTAQLGSIALR